MMGIDSIISRQRWHLENGSFICGLQRGVALIRRGTFIYAIFSSLKTIKPCQFDCVLQLLNAFTELSSLFFGFAANHSK